MVDYPSLEPNHSVRVTDKLIYVRCPFVDAETSWSANADPDEINCLFCESEEMGGTLPLPPEDCGE